MNVAELKRLNEMPIADFMDEVLREDAMAKRYAVAKSTSSSRSSGLQRRATPRVGQLVVKNCPGEIVVVPRR
jgi:hypothetical protein